MFRLQIKNVFRFRKILMKCYYQSVNLFLIRKCFSFLWKNFFENAGTLLTRKQKPMAVNSGLCEIYNIKSKNQIFVILV